MKNFKKIQELAINHLSKKDRVLRKIIKKIELKVFKKPNYFQSLVELIISQQLSNKAAETIFRNFKNSFGKNFPNAIKISKIFAKSFRKAGISNAKAKYIKNLGKAIASNNLNLKSIDKFSDAQIIKKLVKQKGIGEWTAEMFLIFSLGRPDIFSKNDLGLKKAIQKYYNFDIQKQSKKFTKLLNRWRPYRSFAARCLWASLDINK